MSESDKDHELVESPQEAFENALLFNHRIEQGAEIENKRFHFYSNWFYFDPENTTDGIFAPAKYIAFKNRNAFINPRMGITGKSKQHLLQWFRVLDNNTAESLLRVDGLNSLADHHGCKLHINSLSGGRGGGIYVLKDEYSVSRSNESYYPEELSGLGLEEGHVKKVLVNKYERNPKAREACLLHYGYNCQVCNLNFESTFGDIGKGIIHVHHIVPLAQIKKNYKVDPVKDLIPLCPNCHAMTHKGKPPYSVEVLKKIRANIA